MESRADEVAEVIAREVGGAVRAVPVEGERAAFAVALPDARVPVLVRDFGHAIGICVTRDAASQLRAANGDRAAIRDAVAATKAWAGSNPPDVVTIFELALDLATTLAGAFDERWTTSIPGTPDPSEVWLHGPEHDAASVGVFHGRAIVAVEGENIHVEAPRRSDLPRARDAVLAAVREQRALHRRNVAVSERIRTLAVELAAELT